MNMRAPTILIAAFFALLNAALGGKILISPAAIYPSHKMIFYRLAEELIKRGHEVVEWQVALKDDRTIEPPKGLQRRIWTIDVADKYIRNMFLHENSSIYNLVWDDRVTEPARKAANWAMMTRVCERMLETRKADFDNLLNEYFDVVIIDDLYNPCGLLYVGLSRRAFVYWSMTHMRTETAWSSQSPSPPSYIPVPGTAYTDEMDFWQRAYNMLSYVKSVYVHQRMILRPIDRVFSKFYDNLTEVFYIERNASFNYINTPPIFDFPRPYMPRVIFVGALHCRKAQPLMGELANFVNSANDVDGFILFTTGFSVPWSKAPNEIISSFVEGFRNVPQKVIWQYDGSPIKDLPPNVFIERWLPVQDLLGHPKCKGHITHGGINSVIESMWHGVPIIGIPIYDEHRDFILRATARKAGFILEKHHVNKLSVAKAVRKLTKTAHYKTNAMVMSDLLTDVPYTELDHAAFWVEFIIRHQEVPQSRSGADDLNIFQYFLIDVLAFLFACFVLWAIVTFYFLKYCLRCCRYSCAKVCGRSSSKIDPKKKKAD